MTTNRAGALFIAILVATGVLAPSTPSSAAVDSTVPAAAGGYQALAPVRILDTGTGVGAAAHSVASHATLTFQVSGRGGIPATGASVAVST
jgi:methylase of polypeptide subunit release factors